MTVRALYRAIAIPASPPPYDRANLKIYYPAQLQDTPEERNSGLVAVNTAMTPFPVVVIMPGINVGPEAYTWLARDLAERGVVTITYSMIAEEMPGYISLTPGLDLTALAPEQYGSRPSATALTPIIEDLHTVNASGVLAGCLDLQHIVLGGHSAGGTVALLNANPQWFDGLCGVFSYAAHTGAATALGYAEDSLMLPPSALPTLIMGGTRDGCIANSSARYGTADDAPTARVERTFDEGLNSARGDSYLALIDGANHFSLVHPLDDSTGRPFIDFPTTRPEPQIRTLLATMIGDFVCAIAKADQKALQRLTHTILEPEELIARGARR